MKHTYQSAPAKPERQPYEQPRIETTDFAVERGFAQSDLTDPQKQEDPDFWS